MTAIPKWLAEILAKPTCNVPEAGRALGLNRDRSYAAAREGFIETIETGPKRRQVPTSWLRRKLMIDEPSMRRTPVTRDEE